MITPDTAQDSQDEQTPTALPTEEPTLGTESPDAEAEVRAEQAQEELIATPRNDEPEATAEEAPLPVTIEEDVQEATQEEVSASGQSEDEQLTQLVAEEDQMASEPADHAEEEVSEPAYIEEGSVELVSIEQAEGGELEVPTPEVTETIEAVAESEIQEDVSTAENQEALITAEEGDEAVDEANEGEARPTEDYDSMSRRELLVVLQKHYGPEAPAASLQQGHRLRKLNDAFFAALDHDRQTALHRHSEGGGDSEAFEFRDDQTTQEFKALYKDAQQRRRQLQDDQEKERTINLKRKQQLLINLREIVDQESDRPLLDEFRKVQEEWRSIGPVPAGQHQELNSQFNFLVDRYYNNRNIYFELKELDRRKNFEIKSDLVRRAQAVETMDTTTVGALQAFNKIFEEFRNIGPASREDNQRLWGEMQQINTRLVERRKQYLEEQKHEADKVGQKRAELAESIAAEALIESDKPQQWQQRGETVRLLVEAWKATGPLYRDQHAELSRTFWAGVKKFYAAKDQFFRKLDRESKANLERRHQLIEQIRALADLEPSRETSEKLRTLIDEWKSAGYVHFKHRDKLNDEFRKAMDIVHKRRDRVFEEERANLARKQEIVSRIEEHVRAKTGTLELIEQLQGEFTAIGHVPFKAKDDIQQGYRDALTRMIANSAALSNEEKNVARMQLVRYAPGGGGGGGFRDRGDRPFGGDRGDRGDRHSGPRGQGKGQDRGPDRGDRHARPGGGGGGGRYDRGGHSEPARPQKGFHLDVRIQALQSEVDNYRNNLEMFANTKNASRIREEYEQRIFQAEQEISMLRDQLKVLREKQD